MHAHFLPLLSAKSEVTLPLMALDPRFYELDTAIITEWVAYMSTGDAPEGDYPTVTIRPIRAAEAGDIEWRAGPPESVGERLYFEAEGDQNMISALPDADRRAVQAFLLRLDRLAAERARTALVAIDGDPYAPFAKIEGLRPDAYQRACREISAHAQRIGGLRDEHRKSDLG